MIFTGGMIAIEIYQDYLLDKTGLETEAKIIDITSGKASTNVTYGYDLAGEHYEAIDQVPLEGYRNYSNSELWSFGTITVKYLQDDPATSKIVDHRLK